MHQRRDRRRPFVGKDDGVSPVEHHYYKAVPITVEVNEPIGGDWEILSSTYKWTKTAAFAAQFAVPVDKDGTAVLRYRVRVRW